MERTRVTGAIRVLEEGGSFSIIQLIHFLPSLKGTELPTWTAEASPPLCVPGPAQPRAAPAFAAGE